MIVTRLPPAISTSLDLEPQHPIGGRAFCLLKLLPPLSSRRGFSIYGKDTAEERTAIKRTNKNNKKRGSFSSTQALWHMRCGRSKDEPHLSLIRKRNVHLHSVPVSVLLGNQVIFADVFHFFREGNRRERERCRDRNKAQVWEWAGQYRDMDQVNGSCFSTAGLMSRSLFLMATFSPAPYDPHFSAGNMSHSFHCKTNRASS